MKFWLAAALVFALVVASVLALYAQGTAKEFQIATPEGGNVTISALNIHTEMPGPVVKAKGNVEIRAKEMVVTAGEADYRMDAGEIALCGQVHLMLNKQN